MPWKEDRQDGSAAMSLPADALRDAVVRLFPHGRIVGCEELGLDTSGAASRKQAGYGRPVKVSV